MRTCTKCSALRSDQGRCSTCRKVYMKTYLSTYSPAYYRANKPEINRKVAQINKRRRNERYAVIQSMKSSPCTDCKQTFPYYMMDFDHRDPTTKKSDVSVMVKQMFTWEAVLAEIAKCDLVCACCHRLRTYKGNNSYRTRLFMWHTTILSELKSETPCLDCGGVFKSCQMDFDHTGSSDKVANVARLVEGSTEDLLAEIGKCHLVCANCHRSRGHTGIRPDAPMHAASVVQRFYAIAARHQLPSDQRLAPFPFPELLGVVSDQELAERTGVSKDMIGWFRRKQGKLLRVHAKGSGPAAKPWHVLAGTMTDKQVAQTADITPVSVCQFRKKMGIPAFTKIQRAA